MMTNRQKELLKWFYQNRDFSNIDQGNIIYAHEENFPDDPDEKFFHTLNGPHRNEIYP